MFPLILIIVATALLCLAMMMVLGSLLRTGIPGVREWFGANLAMVAALLLVAGRGHIPDVLSIVLSNTMLALSAASYYAGSARFLARPPRWRLLFGATLVLTLAIITWRYVFDSVAIRVLVSTSFSAIVCIGIATLLIRYRPLNRRRYNYWFAAILALIFAASQIARGLYFLVLDPQPGDLLFDNVWNTALLTVGAVIMPVMTMSAVMMIHDVMLGEVEHAANHDHMTGALSRKRLETVVAEQIRSARLHGRPLSFLLIDLDHFKRINDTYGHAGGDAVLQEFVQMARSFLRGGDVVGRLGGEEFGVLLPNADAEAALLIADRLREKAAAQVVRGEFGECRYSISGGVATLDREDSFEQLAVRADRALYAAKHGGRNRVLADIAGAELPALAATS